MLKHHKDAHHLDKNHEGIAALQHEYMNLMRSGNYEEAEIIQLALRDKVS